MKKALKIVNIIVIVLLSLFAVTTAGLAIYSLDSSLPLPAMNEEIELLNLEGIEFVKDNDQISYFVEAPKKNVLFIPGGKVEPESYQYLAVKLALEGYDVTIIKALFNLAILTPGYGKYFLDNELENVVIGHSLGGTVASFFSSGDDRVNDIVFLASYPIADVTDKHVLLMTAEFDQVLDRNSLEKYMKYLPSNYASYQIEGGNHAQFGWYGAQKGDGVATIETKIQQDAIIEQVLMFIES